ncbi:MAG: HPP family protein [Bacteroides sp.]|nr:HPP family protein [Bacteroides sp.]
MENNHTTERQKGLFSDTLQRKRYLCALGMILLMVGMSEFLQEKEILFPEMAALTIGMWIVDKRVWRIRRGHLLALMSMGACVGVLIVRYSPLPLVLNIAMAFSCAAIGLWFARSSLFPLISACVLPVLLNTESWVYPLSVFIMTSILIIVQRLMEKGALRKEIIYEPVGREWKKDILRWGYLLLSVLAVSSLAVYSSYSYLIIPPLLVAFVEFTNSTAGFRNRPLLTVLLLVTGALVGVAFQLVGHCYLGLPEVVVALGIFIVLFTLFEWLGKFFAPVGALALIPMLLPAETLLWLPLQVAAGASLFIIIGLVFFQQCYKWSRAQLVYCLIPHYLLSRLSRNRKG